jgi:predicted AlkP superfamily phosphohydrolase/phosphomutase
MAQSRMFILGLDALVPELVDRFIAEGRLPNIARLIERGAYARPLPAMPTHTPVNWTTISTGARPGTHGITGFTAIDRTGDLEAVLPSSDTTNVQVPFLWQLAAQAGKRSLLLKWGGPTLPISVTDGLQVDGCFCVGCAHEIDAPTMHSSTGRADTRKIDLTDADAWSNPPASNLPALATTLHLGKPDSDEQLTLHALLIAAGEAYDTLILASTPDAAAAIDTITLNTWSEWASLAFPSGRNGTVRFKMTLATAGDEPVLELFASQIMPDAGWCGPEDVSAELVEQIGPFLHQPGYKQRQHVYGGWVDYPTLIEEIDYQHDWFGRSMEYLCKRDDYDLIFLHTHAPDYIQDAIMPEAEPLTSPDEATFRESIEFVAQTYESCDRMVGYIVDNVATEADYIAVVSDHGCIGYPAEEENFNLIPDMLVANGLMTYEGQSSEQVGSKPKRGKDELDWSKTKAIFHDSIHIYLNVKGRQPNGCVEPADYDAVRDEIIAMLRAYRDPALGRCPFDLILKSEDARMLGLYGDRVGDIIVTAEPGAHYAEGHGSLMPTARYGLSSLSASFILAGPDVRAGASIDRPCWLWDVAPTLARLMEIPPADSFEGAVLHDMIR